MLLKVGCVTDFSNLLSLIAPQEANDGSVYDVFAVQPDDLFGDNRLDTRLDQLFSPFGPSLISFFESSRLPRADHYLSLGSQDFDSEIL